MEKRDSSLYLSDDDLYLMGKGEWYRSYDKLGAHQATAEDGTAGFHFAVWAPEVQSVSVIGEFNGWDEGATPLSKSASGDIWQGFVPGVTLGQLYKFVLVAQDGTRIYKADPYAFQAELVPGTASRTADVTGYEWGDADWMERRAAGDFMKQPLNIFEVHLGSWRRHGNEPQGEPREDGTWPGPGDPFPAQRGEAYTYDDLADEMVAYVKRMGYSHIEIMPVMEHPFDGSWGYQPTSYFAPTSRYGEPKQFMHFVDACHEAGIGVILDWVPGGFCADAHGLASFNGKMLYEHEIHPNWGTHKFDFSRGQVRTFLISNLLYWVEQYHADGVRMDGVTSMLYLNFGVDDPRQKKFNARGTEENDDAIAFVRQCNSTIGKYHGDVMMIAEESTAWPLVTYPPEDGGLGFNFKWDMGWMNDTLHYMQTDFPWRPGNHRLLTFSTMYQFNENFVLPLSHDEVVNGKCSLIQRMPGDQWRQFAGLRALAFYQMTHSGGKLNFMGNEIGQYIEWRYYEGVEYFLAENYEAHAKQQRFVEALNAFYNASPELWQNAFTSEGFSWLDADNSSQSIISFVRKGDKPGEELVILINFDINAREGFRQGVPLDGVYEEVFNSDRTEFGGSGVTNDGKIKAELEPAHGCGQSVVLRIPPLAGIVLKKVANIRRPKPKAKAETAKKVEKDVKPATKAPTAKAPAAKKPTSKKPAAKKPAAKAPTAKKPATKKAPAAKKPATK